MAQVVTNALPPGLDPLPTATATATDSHGEDDTTAAAQAAITDTASDTMNTAMVPAPPGMEKNRQLDSDNTHNNKNNNTESSSGNKRRNSALTSYAKNLLGEPPQNIDGNGNNDKNKSGNKGSQKNEGESTSRRKVDAPTAENNYTDAEHSNGTRQGKEKEKERGATGGGLNTRFDDTQDEYIHNKLSSASALPADTTAGLSTSMARGCSVDDKELHDLFMNFCRNDINATQLTRLRARIREGGFITEPTLRRFVDTACADLELQGQLPTNCEAPKASKSLIAQGSDMLQRNTGISIFGSNNGPNRYTPAANVIRPVKGHYLLDFGRPEEYGVSAMQSGKDGGQCKLDTTIPIILRLFNTSRHKAGFRISVVDGDGNVGQERRRELRNTEADSSNNGFLSFGSSGETRGMSTYTYSNSLYQLDFSCGEGILKKRAEEHITVKLTLKLSCANKDLCILVGIDVEGGVRRVIVIKAVGENSVFGTNVEDQECIQLAEYKAAIPRVLICLKDHLLRLDGMNVEGVFRVAPDAIQCDHVREALNNGDWALSEFLETGNASDASGVSMCCANLIKVWFRYLPHQIMDGVPPEVLLECKDRAGAMAVFERLGEPQSSLLLWVVDLMCRACVNEEVNRMNAKACAIVMGPNLFVPNIAVNPMESLMLSQKAVTFLHHLIQWRYNSIEHLLK